MDLDVASLQLNAIQEALKQAQERQSSALQKSRENEEVHLNEVKTLRNEIQKISKQLENETKEKNELRKYMQHEIQECSQLAEKYKLQAEKALEQSDLKDKECRTLTNDRESDKESFNRLLIEKDKTFKRNEATMNKLINDLTDSLTLSRATQAELNDSIRDYQQKIIDAEHSINDINNQTQVLKKENVLLKEKMQSMEKKNQRALQEADEAHVQEIKDLKNILEDYSGNLAEMRPIIEESQNIRSSLLEKGYKTDVVDTIQMLQDEADCQKRNAIDLQEKLNASLLNTSQLKQSQSKYENMLAEYKADMQKLNDIYTKEKQELEQLTQDFQNQQEIMCGLEEEVSSLRQEKLKVDQLRQANIELNGFLKKTQAEYTQVIHGLETTVKDWERKNAEVSAHCWNMADHLKEAQTSYEQEHKLRLHLEEELTQAQAQQTSSDAIIKNIAMNLRHEESVSKEEAKKALEEEANMLRELLETSSREKESMEAQLYSGEEARRAEKVQVSLAINELTEAVHSAKSRNEELTQALYEARRQLLAVGEDSTSSQQKVKRLECQVEADRTEHQEAIEEYERRMRLDADSLDGMRIQYSSATTQIEVLQSQIRDSQVKYFTAIQAEKDTNVSLRSDISALATLKEDLEAKLKNSDTQVQGLKDIMQREISAASGMSNSLRDELEKRLNELMEIRKERDVLRTEKESFATVAAEREKAIKRNEVAFQKAMESDRSRLQAEVKAAEKKGKLLDEEKQDLLRENEELSKKLIESQRELSELSKQVSMNRKQYEDAGEQLLTLQVRFNDAIKELKEANRTEQTLREEYSKSEKLFHDEVLRLEGLVKESKKSALAQVSQLATQLKSNTDEINGLKKYNGELLDAERRAVGDADKARTELAFRNQIYGDAESKFGDEIALLKADLRDSKSKYNQVAAANSALEVELMSLKVKLTKSEGETNHCRQLLSDGEERYEAAAAEMEEMRLKLGKVIKTYNDLKLKFVETEEAYLKQGDSLEQMSAELGQAEREGLAEARGLRVALASVNIEISELKTLQKIQNQELDDAKANLARVQETSNSSINSLLQELKAAEDNFAEYRRSHQDETEALQRRVTDLNGIVERSKDNLEEIFVKSKTEKSERDVRMNTLELELSRFKSLLGSKELRVVELEKQHQENRNIIQKLKEAIHNDERRIAENDSLVKRLEAKIFALESSKTAEQREELLPSSSSSTRRLISSRSSNQLLGNRANRNENLDFKLQQQGSPLRRASLDDLFASDPDSTNRGSFDSDAQMRGILEPPLNVSSENIDRVTAALAARSSFEANKPRNSAAIPVKSPRAGSRGKITKGSKGLVSDVRETVHAAARQTENLDSSELAMQPVPTTDQPSSDKGQFELSIERTQQFLQARLGIKTLPANSKQTLKQGAGISNDSSNNPTPAAQNYGANYLFKADSDDEDESPPVVKLSAPKLKPATPP